VTDVPVQGLADLDRLLKTLPVKVEANILRGAVRAGQKVVADKARSMVPKDSGALAKSIRVSVNMKAARRGYVRADVVAGNKTAWYANLIEQGTGSHYTGSGRSQRKPYTIKPKKREGALLFGGVLRPEVVHPGIKPQPFMRPAAELLDGPALEAFAAYVRNRLPKELAKAGQ